MISSDVSLFSVLSCLVCTDCIADFLLCFVISSDVQIEKLEDAVLPVSEIVKRCPAKQLMAIYKVPTFDDTDQFLQHIALVRGKLKKGGTVDVRAAAKVVLQDWNDGRIPFYTMPPQREAQEGHAAAEVVTQWASDFDADQVPYSQTLPLCRNDFW